MPEGYFDGARLAALYRELQQECAEYARAHGGAITAAEENEIAARLMAAARNDPPSKAA
ncbi:MAG: hypothetical protein AB7F74_16290 [Parvibaculaceae bacterium]